MASTSHACLFCGLSPHLHNYALTPNDLSSLQLPAIKTLTTAFGVSWDLTGGGLERKPCHTPGLSLLVCLQLGGCIGGGAGGESILRYSTWCSITTTSPPPLQCTILSVGRKAETSQASCRKLHRKMPGSSPPVCIRLGWLRRCWGYLVIQQPCGIGRWPHRTLSAHAIVGR